MKSARPLQTAIAFTLGWLLVLPAASAWCQELEQDDPLRLPLWTDRPVKVDPAGQNYERLPALVVKEERPTGVSVPHRIRMVDSASFSFEGLTYRMAGVQPIAIRRICHGSNGHRWTCGRMAALFLGNLVRGKRLHCNVLDQVKDTTVADCNVGTRNLAEEIVKMGYGRALGNEALITVESDAIRQKKGLWENPACLSSFETC